MSAINYSFVDQLIALSLRRIGSRTVNVVPSSTVLSTDMVPECFFTIP